MKNPRAYDLIGIVISLFFDGDEHEPDFFGLAQERLV